MRVSMSKERVRTEENEGEEGYLPANIWNVINCVGFCSNRCMYNNNNIINRATARAIDFESKIVSPSSNHSSRGPDPDPVPVPDPDNSKLVFEVLVKSAV